MTTTRLRQMSARTKERLRIGVKTPKEQAEDRRDQEFQVRLAKVMLQSR